MKEFDELVRIMTELRSDTGCPWDREQDHTTLVPYLIEEAYEVIEAITHGTREDLCEELGDLLLQIVFHAQIASEKGEFSMAEVAAGISEKLRRRHPHVFADSPVNSAEEVVIQWNEIKKIEKARRGIKKIRKLYPCELPALQRASKLQGILAKEGFSEENLEESLNVLEEDIDRARQNLSDKDTLSNLSGTLLFHAVNTARLSGADPEVSLRRACSLFETSLNTHKEDSKDV